MSEEVQIAWKLSIAGAEDVKQQLAQVHEQFNRGEISVEQYGKQINQQNSTLRALTSNTQFQTRAWLAQHPTINTLSRSMSGFNRVLSATVQAMNLMNTATLLMRTDSGNLAEAQNRLAEAQRNLAAATTPEEYEKWSRAVAEANDNLESMKKNMNDDFNNRLSQFGINAAFIGTSILATLPRLTELRLTLLGIGASVGTAFASFAGLFVGLAPVLATFGALAGTVATVVGAIALALYYALTPGDQFAEMLKGIFPDAAAGIDAASETIDKFFRETLIGGAQYALTWLAVNFVGGAVLTWDAVKSAFSEAENSISAAFTAFWNGLDQVAKNVSNSVITTVSGMTDAIISAVRRALDYLAKLPGNIASGIGNFISGGSSKSPSGTSIPKYAAGGSFVTNGPQMFIAGEGGVREEVSVKSIGRSGGSSSESGTTINNYITVGGSIAAERDLEQLINKYGIREARRRGWKAGRG